jgi:hypothetical protein
MWLQLKSSISLILINIKHLNFLHFCINSFAMKNLQDVNTAIFDLRKRGYRLDFNFYSKYIICVPLKLKIDLTDVEIDETYKFPSKEYPGRQNILCALKTHGGQRGILYEVSDRVFELFEVVRPKTKLSNTKEKKQKRKDSYPSQTLLTAG